MKAKIVFFEFVASSLTSLLDFCPFLSLPVFLDVNRPLGTTYAK